MPLLYKGLYTWSLIRLDTHEGVVKSLPGLEILEMKEYAVPDCFAEDCKDDKRAMAERVARFQHGYWAQTIRDTLIENGIKNAKEICEEIFGEVIPKYCYQTMDKYPEAYGGLYYMLRKKTSQ